MPVLFVDNNDLFQTTCNVSGTEKRPRSGGGLAPVTEVVTPS